MTVSKTTTRKMTTLEKAQQFAHGRCLGFGMWTLEEAADFADSLTAEPQKENAQLMAAIRDSLPHIRQAAGQIPYGAERKHPISEALRILVAVLSKEKE